MSRWLGLLALLFVAFSNILVHFYASKYVYENLENLPNQKVGLVLGTSKYVANGSSNYYFNYRIAAAVKLFNAGKIDYILVSGDNATKQYNEPRDMFEALAKAGIPKNRIVLDFAGFRTLDSIVRCKEVFMQESFVIISQGFHNQRAVFIAHAHGINAIGYNAQDVKANSGFKTRVRELFARTKVFIDLMLEKRPKFLGEQIQIGA
ncbi:MAG: SanA/YdcF family protein [Bacteroidia bacterium]